MQALVVGMWLKELLIIATVMFWLKKSKAKRPRPWQNCYAYYFMEVSSTWCRTCKFTRLPCFTYATLKFWEEPGYKAKVSRVCHKNVTFITLHACTRDKVIARAYRHQRHVTAILSCIPSKIQTRQWFVTNYSNNSCLDCTMCTEDYMQKQWGFFSDNLKALCPDIRAACYSF